MHILEKQELRASHMQRVENCSKTSKSSSGPKLPSRYIFVEGTRIPTGRTAGSPICWPNTLKNEKRVMTIGHLTNQTHHPLEHDAHVVELIYSVDRYQVPAHMYFKASRRAAAGSPKNVRHKVSKTRSTNCYPRFIDMVLDRINTPEPPPIENTEKQEHDLDLETVV